MSLRETIEAYYLRRMKKPLNLDDPRGFNDQINWLKLYDQSSAHVVCCDKWAVRDWVADRAGREVLIPAQLSWPPTTFPAMAKCTHDSGSTRRIESESEAELRAAHRWLTERCQLPYGVDKGEWAYGLVQPRILVEAVIPEPVVDFKFHCAHGEPTCCFVVSNRSTGHPTGTALAADGSLLDWWIDGRLKFGTDREAVYPGDDAWRDLVELARTLSNGWRYVRVDLYSVRGRPMFGEMTFWPLAGCVVARDIDKVADLMRLDLSYKLQPIVR